MNEGDSIIQAAKLQQVLSSTKYSNDENSEKKSSRRGIVVDSESKASPIADRVIKANTLNVEAATINITGSNAKSTADQNPEAARTTATSDKDNGKVKASKADNLTKPLPVKAILTSNEATRYKKIFKIFKDVVFPGKEAERTSARNKEKLKSVVAGGEDKKAETTAPGEGSMGWGKQLLAILALVGTLIAAFGSDIFASLSQAANRTLRDLAKRAGSLAKSVYNAFNKPGKTPKSTPKPKPTKVPTSKVPKPPTNIAKAAITSSATGKQPKLPKDLTPKRLDVKETPDVKKNVDAATKPKPKPKPPTPKPKPKPKGAWGSFKNWVSVGTEANLKRVGAAGKYMAEGTVHNARKVASGATTAGKYVVEGTMHNIAKGRNFVSNIGGRAAELYEAATKLKIDIGDITRLNPKNVATFLRESIKTKFRKTAQQALRGMHPKNILKTLKGIGVIAPLIEAAFTVDDLRVLKRTYIEDPQTPEEKEATDNANMDAGSRLLQAFGSLGGAVLGGAALTPLLGPVGTFVGALGGDLIGRYLADLLGRTILKKQTPIVGEWVMKNFVTPMPEGKSIGEQAMKLVGLDGDPEVAAPVNDFIVQRGLLTPFSDKDSILGVRDGGIIDKLLFGVDKKKSNILQNVSGSLSSNILQTVSGSLSNFFKRNNDSNLKSNNNNNFESIQQVGIFSEMKQISMLQLQALLDIKAGILALGGGAPSTQPGRPSQPTPVDFKPNQLTADYYSTI
ncbi:hypothetical protein N9Z65_00950 [bacterium]|nr:hypothetical protein [bacterium]